MIPTIPKEGLARSAGPDCGLSLRDWLRIPTAAENWWEGGSPRMITAHNLRSEGDGSIAVLARERRVLR